APPCRRERRRAPLAGKLQRPLDRLEARLLAQRIEQWVGLHVHEPRVTQARRGLEPCERLGAIAPLRVDLSVLVGGGLAPIRLYSSELGRRTGVPAELLVHHRQTILTSPVVSLGLARCACALQVPEPV